MKETVKRLFSFLVATAVFLTFATVDSSVFADVERENVVTELLNTAEVGGVAYSSAESYEGEWSVHVGYDSGWSEHPIAAKCSEFGMMNGGVYDISFYFKGAVESLYVTAKSLCIWGNENYIAPPSYPDVGQKITQLENGWYKFEVSDYLLADANKALLFTTNGGNNGDIVDDFYLDNLSVVDRANNKELIKNGGFEPSVNPPEPGDDTDRKNEPVRELLHEQVEDGIEYSSEQAYDGEWSVHISQAKNLAPATQRFGVEAGKTYNASFYIKGYTGSLWFSFTGSTRVLITDTEIRSGSIEDIKKFEVGNGWYKVEINNAKAVAANWNPPFLIAEGSPDFYLDNLSMKEIDENGSEVRELIQNGGFEPSVNPPEPPDPPEPAESPVRKDAPFVRELLHEQAEEGIEYSSAQAYDGKWSVHINQAKNLAPEPKKFGIEEGKTYNASFYIKGYTGSLWFSFTGSTRVMITDNEIRSGSIEDIKKFEVGNGWYKVEINNAKAVAAGWTPPFLLAEGSPDFYLDNLSVAEIDENGNEIRELIENGSFEPPAMEFGDYKIMDGSDGEKIVSIDVINHSAGASTPVQLILATYSGTFMTNCAKEENPTFVEDNDKWVTLSQSVRVKSGEKVVIFLWDSAEGMTMLLPSQSLNQ